MAVATTMSGRGIAREDALSAQLVGWLALWSITLIRLPIYVGAQAAVRGAMVLMLLAAIVWMSGRVRQSARVGMGALLALTLSALVGLALFRASELGVLARSSAVADAVTYVLLVVFAILLVGSSRSQAERDRRLTYVALAPGLYGIVNVTMYFAGLRAPETGFGSASYAAELLGYLGIQVTRAQFPLATSVNLFSITMAAGLVGAVLLYFHVPRAPRRFCVAAGFCCLLAIIMGDSRVALAVAVGVIALFVLKGRRVGSGWVAFVIPFLPLVLVGGIAIVDSLGASQSLSTEQRDFDSASGRLGIWGPAWEFLSQHPVDAVFGWGGYGHYASGASLLWLDEFRGFLETPLVSAQTHSLVLQTVFDLGWVGLAVLVACAWATLRSLDRGGRVTPDAPFGVLSAMLITLLVCGITEVAPTYFSPEALMTMLLIMGVAAVRWRPGTFSRTHRP